MASVPPYPDKPSKRIVVCCDGTWNDSDGTLLPPTNVAKIARSIRRQATLEDHRVIPQVVFYQSGIGTKSPNTEVHALDGLTGRGIKENVRQAYGFVCNNYLWGDEIILIGFSRGAYTARVIASLITDLGILKKHGLGYFFSIFDAWQRQNVETKTDATGKATHTFTEIKKKLQDPTLDLAYSGVPIKACAVWDTVGALGIPIDEPPTFIDEIKDGVRAALSSVTPSFIATQLGSYDPLAFTFVDTVVSPMVQHAFHALALDEHRKHYTPTIWEKPEGQNWPETLKQVWFAGNHTLIGGGNRTNNAMPNIALAWMVDQLRAHNILDVEYNHVNRTAKDDPLIAVIGQGEADPTSGKLVDNPTDIVDKLDLGDPRTPTQYCRVNRVSQKPTSIRLVNTYETVHASVRRRFWDRTDLESDGSKYESKALKDKWEPHTPDPSAEGDKAYWKVRKTVVEAPKPDVGIVTGLLHSLHLPGTDPAETPAPAVPPANLEEEPFTEFEWEILKAWSFSGDSLETFDLQQATR